MTHALSQIHIVKPSAVIHGIRACLAHLSPASRPLAVLPRLRLDRWAESTRLVERHATIGVSQACFAVSDCVLRVALEARSRLPLGSGNSLIQGWGGCPSRRAG